jgi:SAM-dependent methyltransferase
MIDVSAIIDNVRLADGIWIGEGDREISYPKDGNDQYFLIEDDSYWFGHRNNCIVEVVNKFSPRRGLFMEIGSGNGFVAKAITAAGFETLLIEPSMQGVCNARKRGLENLVCAPFEQIHFVNNFVDAVGVFDVLEHIREDSAFLTKINSVLSPGGTLFLTVPAHGILWSGEDVHDGHFRRYSLRDLRVKLIRAGFSLLYATHFFLLLTLPIFIMRTMPFVMGIKRSQTSDTYWKENSVGNTFVKKLLSCSFRRELTMIGNQAVCRMGSSIIAVARKNGAAFKKSGYACFL